MLTGPHSPTALTMPEEPYLEARSNEAAAWICSRCGFVMQYLAPIRRDEIAGCVRCGSSEVRALPKRTHAEGRPEPEPWRA